MGVFPVPGRLCRPLRLKAAEVSVVDFDQAGKLILAVPIHHRFADFVGHRPGSFITNSQCFLKGKSGTSPFIVGNQVNRPKPSLMRRPYPATVNRRLNTLKRYFDWAMRQDLVAIDFSKPVKFIPEEKSSPRQMTDKEEAALMAAVEKNGNIRDKTLLLVILQPV